MHGDFLNKLTRTIHTLYSRWRTQQTHACFQLGLSAVQTSDTTSKTHGVLLCNVSYHVLYLDTVSGYVSYCGKMYRCRPMHAPSGFARDAVSITWEFDNEFANFKSENEKRKSFKNESLIHSRNFGLHRRAIAAIRLKLVSNRNRYDH